MTAPVPKVPTTPLPTPDPPVKWKKLIAGHYHVTTPKGTFWVAQCEGAPKSSHHAWPTIWQVGVVNTAGYEELAFAASDTRKGCLALATGSEP